QPASNTWSVMQVLEHLYLMERMIVSRVKDQLENGVDQPTEDKPFHLAVDRSRKVDAPAQVTPSNEKQTLEEMKSKLAESRAALIELEETASEDKLK
ncbi:DinB family protein, partial [Bacillus subtilis]|nr:DinB family protein [Bacillus subtilis]